MKNRLYIVIIAIFALFTLQSCGVKVKYSFTGASIPVAAKTYSVDYFPNRALLIVPSLSTTLTEKLRTYIQDNTSLIEVTDGSGDLRFEGEITGYTQKPVNITANEVAASNRLTIEVRCAYTNTIDGENDFDSRFSQYSDYSIDADYDAIEESLIDEITDVIVEDIYNKAFVNW